MRGGREINFTNNLKEINSQKTRELNTIGNFRINNNNNNINFHYFNLFNIQTQFSSQQRFLSTTSLKSQLQFSSLRSSLQQYKTFYYKHNYTTESKSNEDEEDEEEKTSVEKLLEQEDQPSSIEEVAEGETLTIMTRPKKELPIPLYARKYLTKELVMFQYEANDELFELFLVNKFNKTGEMSADTLSYCITIAKALVVEDINKAMRIYRLLRSRGKIPVAIFEMFLYFDCLHPKISTFQYGQIIQEMLRVSCAPSKILLEIFIMGYARSVDSWLLIEWGDLYLQQDSLSPKVISYLIERLILRKEYDHALKYYLAYEEINPFSRIPPDLKLQILLKLDREEEAISILNSMRFSNTVSSSDYLALFKHYLENDNYDQAVSIIFQLLESKMYPSSDMYHSLMLHFYEQNDPVNAWKLYKFLLLKPYLTFESIIILSLNLIKGGEGDKIATIFDDCGDRITFPPKFYKIAIRELINQNKVEVLTKLLKKLDTIYHKLQGLPDELVKLTFNACIMTGSFTYAHVLLKNHPTLMGVMPLYYYLQPPANDDEIVEDDFDDRAEAQIRYEIDFRISTANPV